MQKSSFKRPKLSVASPANHHSSSAAPQTSSTQLPRLTNEQEISVMVAALTNVISGENSTASDGSDNALFFPQYATSNLFGLPRKYEESMRPIDVT
ncbi:hypothetical protein HS088_TW07G01217 [Tripterygium wilfordii]|uniref:Uncharacterized protein n=1 Tax=Tripterygium wilfordii TaxID=458696 RepID=A0A7J7DGW9_TRIWF|nr:hypothetical protein HS088_TW07G01217 [Tripterygium wilfordii]